MMAVDDLRHQDISSRDIDLLFLEYLTLCSKGPSQYKDVILPV